MLGKHYSTMMPYNDQNQSSKFHKHRPHNHKSSYASAQSGSSKWSMQWDTDDSNMFPSSCIRMSYSQQGGTRILGRKRGLTGMPKYKKFTYLFLRTILNSSMAFVVLILIADEIQCFFGPE